MLSSHKPASTAALFQRNCLYESAIVVKLCIYCFKLSNNSSQETNFIMSRILLLRAVEVLLVAQSSSYDESVDGWAVLTGHSASPAFRVLLLSQRLGEHLGVFVYRNWGGLSK